MCNVHRRSAIAAGSCCEPGTTLSKHFLVLEPAKTKTGDDTARGSKAGLSRHRSDIVFLRQLPVQRHGPARWLALADTSHWPNRKSRPGGPRPEGPRHPGHRGRGEEHATGDIRGGVEQRVCRAAQRRRLPCARCHVRERGARTEACHGADLPPFVGRLGPPVEQGGPHQPHQRRAQVGVAPGPL